MANTKKSATTKKDKNVEGTPVKTPKSNKKKSSSDSEDVKEPVKKTKPTLDSVRDEVNALKEMFEAEIEKPGSARAWKTAKKRLESIYNKLPKIAKKKARDPNKEKKKTAFDKPKIPSTELATFLKLKKGELISMADCTRAICVYTHLKDDETRDAQLKWKWLNKDGRDLRNKETVKNADGKDVQIKLAIKPDDKLTKLLKYDQYKKDVKKGKIFVHKGKKQVEDETCYYNVVTRLIRQQLTDPPTEAPTKKTKKAKAVESEDEDDE